jgi:hypothetical protein
MNALTSHTFLALGILVVSSSAHAQQQNSAIPAGASVASPCKPSEVACKQTAHDKFMSYAIAAVGPRALFFPLIPAVYLMAFPPDRYPRDWRQGLPALGRNYGNELAAQWSLETARFVTSVIVHEDLRYHRSASRNPLLRAGHAVAYSFVDKSDSGHAQIAWSNFAGAAASGYVGRLYLPAGFNDVSHADTSVAIHFGLIAGRNVAAEFSAEFSQLARKLHLKVIRLLPEWWTPLDR